MLQTFARFDQRFLTQGKQHPFVWQDLRKYLQAMFQGVTDEAPDDTCGIDCKVTR